MIGWLITIFFLRCFYYSVRSISSIISIMATARRRGSGLNPQLRSRLCELRALGFNYSRINQIHPEVCVSTIRTTCVRETKRVNNQSNHRSGAPRKLSDEQRDHLHDLAVHQNPHIKNRELVERWMRLSIKDQSKDCFGRWGDENGNKNKDQRSK